MKKKILLVDDQADGMALERVMPGYEVRTVPEASAAISVAKQFQPDVILLDLVMPDMHGDVLAERMRTEPALRKIPIVFISSLVHSCGDDDEPVEIGPYPAFGKPFNIEALKRCIEEQISGYDSAASGVRKIRKGMIVRW